MFGRYYGAASSVVLPPVIDFFSVAFCERNSVSSYSSCFFVLFSSFIRPPIERDDLSKISVYQKFDLFGDLMHVSHHLLMLILDKVGVYGADHNLAFHPDRHPAAVVGHPNIHIAFPLKNSFKF